MRDQTVIWTALPNGYHPNGQLRLSVAVSPRLVTNESNPSLSMFPDWANWPQSVGRVNKGDRTLTFKVQFGNLTPVDATFEPTLDNMDNDPNDFIVPDPKFWQGVFGPSNGGTTSTFRVQSHTFQDHSNRMIRTYPARHVTTFLRQEYAKLIKESPSAPAGFLVPYSKSTESQTNTTTGNQSGFAAKGPLQQSSINDTKGEYQATNDPHEFAADPHDTKPTQTFAQLGYFHDRPAPDPNFAPAPPPVDFHQILGAIGDYPQIMRMMGLAFDLIVPVPLGIGSSVMAMTVKVIPQWASFFDTAPGNAEGKNFNAMPLTNCDISTTVFAAHSRSGEIPNRMLALDNGDLFDVSEIDLDGAALKALDFVNNMQLAQDNQAPDTPLDFALPSMRSAGISVRRFNRAPSLADTFATNKSNNDALAANKASTSNPPPSFDAEDLTRGYRVDVLGSSEASWLSLCMRTGTYQFMGNGKTMKYTINDEGLIQLAAASRSDAVHDFYVHESLFRWTGWSLVAPRPNKAIDKPAPHDPNQITIVPGEQINTATPGMPFSTFFVAQKGTLARLRYGGSYRLRARAVDLAGNSVDPASTDASHASSTFLYGRFEPIASPTVVYRKPRTEGEHLERLVIRSNYPAAVDHVATTVERHLLAPRIAELTAEEHGALDTSKGGPDPTLYNMIKGRDAASLGAVKGATPDPGNFNAPYFDIDALNPPWLPDVVSRGFALFNPPNTSAGTVLTAAWDLASNQPVWPNVLGTRLQLVEGSSAPQNIPPPKNNGPARVIQLQLPKAHVVTVPMSSFLNDTDLSQMGVWKMLHEEGLDTAELRTKATTGQLWAITPARNLVLVHAVRQPLVRPSLVQLKNAEVIHTTYSTLTDDIPIDRRSTVKVDMFASWTDPVDAVGTPGPVDQFHQLHLVEEQVLLDGTPAAKLSLSPFDGDFAPALKHEFGDTKHHTVTYWAIATSRFAEYFQEHADVQLSDTTSVVIDSRGVNIHSEEVSSQQNGTKTVYVRQESPGGPGDYVIDYAKGAIARTATSKIPRSTKQAPFSVHVDFLPKITRDSRANDDPTIAAPTAVVRNILNRKRPDAPKVLYVVPIFSWNPAAPTADSSGKITSTRKGQGLRVYLDRPWWSSGAGERLGVVIWPAPANSPTPPDPPEPLVPYVTRWGADPVWVGGATNSAVTKDAFSLADANADNLTLDELSTQSSPPTVSVAGHQVGFDATRQLWYCDIQIDAGASYFPFVRLALVRFQPDSVPDAHLSRVFLADFAQLTPDRSVTLTTGTTTSTVNLNIQGLGYTGNSLGAGPSIMQVTVQQRQTPDVPGDLGWVDVVGHQTTLPGTIDSNNNVTWSGPITLPAARGSKQMRLVIRELESYTFKPDPDAPTQPTTAQRTAFLHAIAI